MHIILCPFNSGLVSDSLEAYLRPIELYLQTGFIRSICARRLENHGLEVEPDAVREKEARRGGQEDQVDKGLWLL